MLRYFKWLVLMGLLGVMQARAVDGGERVPLAAGVGQATVQVFFSPGQDVAGEIVAAVRRAHRQVLVQAYSFTHDGVAAALREAHRRGVDVVVLADRGQTENMDRAQVPGLARAGLPVWLDGEHQSAHNKVMLIDAGTPAATIITGSFNFTRAAQHKNAENTVFISGNDALMQAYLKNWRQHLSHAAPLVIH